MRDNRYKTCLLVEDDPEDQQFFIDTLHSISARTGCYAVSNGVEALALLLDESIRPDVIFTDIEMPRMNGEELVERIAAMELLKGIPIIIYSSSCMESKTDKLREMGVVACYSKAYYHRLPDILMKYFGEPYRRAFTIL